LGRGGRGEERGKERKKEEKEEKRKRGGSFQFST